MSHVCGGFNEKKIARTFASIFLSRCSRPIKLHASIFRASKKSACSPSAVNDLFKTYCKTPVPLLVRFLSYVPSAVARNLLNLFKTKLKKHRFSEVKFRKVLLAAVPLTVLCVDIASFFAMCQKHKKNQYILHAFYVRHGPCGRRNAEFLNRPLDTSVVRFFFGVQRSD